MIHRSPILRDQIKEYLQRQILNGKIGYEDRLSLVDISKQLAVSVTPTREALGQLQQSGIVEVIPNRGFFIPKLELDIAKEIYPIIGGIEGMAIRASEGIQDLHEKLIRIEKRINNASPQARVKHDNTFHELLVSKCSNSILKRMISDLKLRVIFYEAAYMNDSEFVSRSQGAHQDILSAVEQDDSEKAAKLVETHWSDSLEFVKTYFEDLREIKQ